MEYKVLEAFELDGAMQEVGSLVTLTDEQATEFAAKVEKVEAPSTPSGEPTTPSGDGATPSTGETPKGDEPKEGEPGWVGGHTV